MNSLGYEEIYSLHAMISSPATYQNFQRGIIIRRLDHNLTYVLFTQKYVGIVGWRTFHGSPDCDVIQSLGLPVSGEQCYTLHSQINLNTPYDELTLTTPDGQMMTLPMNDIQRQH